MLEYRRVPIHIPRGRRVERLRASTAEMDPWKPGQQLGLNLGGPAMDVPATAATPVTIATAAAAAVVAVANLAAPAKAEYTKVKPGIVKQLKKPHSQSVVRQRIGRRCRQPDHSEPNRQDNFRRPDDLLDRQVRRRYQDLGQPHASLADALMVDVTLREEGKNPDL